MCTKLRRHALTFPRESLARLTEAAGKFGTRRDALLQSAARGVCLRGVGKMQAASRGGRNCQAWRGLGSSAITGKPACDGGGKSSRERALPLVNVLHMHGPPGAARPPPRARSEGSGGIGWEPGLRFRGHGSKQSAPGNSGAARAGTGQRPALEARASHVRASPALLGEQATGLVRQRGVLARSRRRDGLAGRAVLHCHLLAAARSETPAQRSGCSEGEEVRAGATSASLSSGISAMCVREGVCMNVQASGVTRSAMRSSNSWW